MARPEELTRQMPVNTRDRLKWAQLRALTERDAQDERVRHMAQLLKDAAMGRREVFIALCQAMARDGIVYVSDTARTGGEDIAGVTRPYGDPLEAFERGADDCDAKARFCVALLLAGGLGARLADWWDKRTGDLAHVGAEVQIGGKWNHLETILSRARFGDEPKDVPPEVGSKDWRFS